ncbi:TadE/TadG family type IV pilus assembly protein [Tundrisphaera lichenicola]|uniref:TadE/TadG family type IV pilus assembly protein n=1 Tax=Tundrisphaera lichenicola TaxID=2029860 RepID=UPI003EBB1714
MRREIRPTRRRRGAVAVELALSMVLVILPMLFGIWEIGCLLDAQQTLTSAVREGGRQAASGAMTNAQVRQVVLQYLSNAGVSTTNVVVTVTNTGSGTDVSLATQLDPIIVSATLPFANVDWSSTGQFVPRTATLTASCQWYSAKDIPYASPPAAPLQ